MTTQREVEAAFFALIRELPQPKGSWSLERWSPGDGRSRYRINVIDDETGGESSPFLSTYWLGAGEAREAMVFAFSVLVWSRYRNAEVRGETGKEVAA